MKKYILLFCLASLSTAVFMACSGSSGQNCVPGDVKTCPCLGNTEGVQVCADDGSRWEACQCQADDGGDEDAGFDGSADDGDAGVDEGDAGGDDGNGDIEFDAGADQVNGDDGGGDDGAADGGDAEADTDVDGGADGGADGGDDGGEDGGVDADAGGGDAATCQVGSTEYQDCGTCGWQVRNCVDPGIWEEDWSRCTEEGPCLPPDAQDISCGNCGTQAQECRSQCSMNISGYCQRECWWEDIGGCTGQGPCSPPQTMPCDLCGTATCRQDCEWRRCNYDAPGPAPDQFEPNDTEAQETYLGAIDDDDDTWHTTASYTNINPEGDVDHFRIRYNDVTAEVLGPYLRLTVPTGQTHEINVRADCLTTSDQWTTSHQYGEGTHSFYVNYGCCSLGCAGDDSVDVHIWISAIWPDSCEAYTLEWSDD